VTVSPGTNNTYASKFPARTWKRPGDNIRSRRTGSANLGSPDGCRYANNQTFERCASYDPGMEEEN
jgi:hypothetical protein